MCYFSFSHNKYEKRNQLSAPNDVPEVVKGQRSRNLIRLLHHYEKTGMLYITGNPHSWFYSAEILGTHDYQYPTHPPQALELHVVKQ